MEIYIFSLQESYVIDLCSSQILLLSEIVVLSVDTQNKAFEGFIKSRLNYKKISKEAIGDLTKFKIPVTITKNN